MHKEPDVTNTCRNYDLSLHRASHWRGVCSFIVIYKAPQNITFGNATFNEESDKWEATVTFNENGNEYIDTAETDKVEADNTVEYAIASGENYIVENSFDKTTGKFTIAGAGTIVINAIFSGNDRYEKTTVPYILTVKKDTQTIGFNTEDSEFTGSVTVTNGDKNFVAPVLDNTGVGTGAVTYTSNNTNVVTVDEITGALTFTNEIGTATITATKAACADYEGTEASYTITVEDWVLSYPTVLSASRRRATG